MLPPALLRATNLNWVGLFAERCAVLGCWEQGAFALFTVTTPASAQGITCSDPQKPMLKIGLMFGRNIGGALGVT
jgi:hypothetical protein